MYQVNNRGYVPQVAGGDDGCKCASDSSVITKWVLISAALWFAWNKTKLPEKVKLR